jgi:hypothetical protein
VTAKLKISMQTLVVMQNDCRLRSIDPHNVCTHGVIVLVNTSVDVRHFYPFTLQPSRPVAFIGLEKPSRPNSEPRTYLRRSFDKEPPQDQVTADLPWHPHYVLGALRQQPNKPRLYMHQIPRY